MIQATIIAMTVFGCGDQAVKCETITGPETTWESIAECDAEIPKILLASSDAPYPVITATCNANIDSLNENKFIEIAEKIDTNPVQTMDGLSTYDVSNSTEFLGKTDKDDRKSNVIIRYVKSGYSLVETTTSTGFKKLKKLKERLSPRKRLFVLLKE